MNEYQVDAIINEDFDNPITISTIEANSEGEAIDKAIELVYERGDDVDEDSDTVDIINVKKVSK